MVWTHAPTLTAFLDLHEADLLKRESQNSILMGFLAAVRAGRVAPDDVLFYGWTAPDDPSGCAVLSMGRKELLLTETPTAAMAPWVEMLSVENRLIEEMVGPVDVCQGFADHWSAQHAVDPIVDMRQGIYELTAVKMPDAAGGHLRQAGPADSELAGQYFHEFHHACFPEASQPRAQADVHAARLIEKKRIYFWADANGELVSMAAKVRETENTACISLVYTPPKYRGCGHAARVVGSLSQQLLDGGKTACNLFTDMSNPTSNGVYIRLGYVKISEQYMLRFEPRARDD